MRPDDPDTLYYVGRALLKKHEPAGAADVLRQALRVNPDDSHASNALAVALAGMRDFAGARTELEHAQKIEPHNPLYERNLHCLDREMRDCELGF